MNQRCIPPTDVDADNVLKFKQPDQDYLLALASVNVARQDFKDAIRCILDWHGAYATLPEEVRCCLGEDL